MKDHKTVDLLEMVLINLKGFIFELGYLHIGNS